MMKRTVILVFSLLVLAGVRGWADDEPQALVLARQRYKAQLKPIQDRYVQNLEIMKRKHVQHNDHVAVGIINQEIEKVHAFQKDGESSVDKEESKASVANKCFLYYPPDNKWMKILYLRPDGKIIGSNHPSEVLWTQKGKDVDIADANGTVTGEFRAKKTDDGKLYFENEYQGQVVLIMREP